MDYFKFGRILTELVEFEVNCLVLTTPGSRNAAAVATLGCVANTSKSISNLNIFAKIKKRILIALVQDKVFGEKNMASKISWDCPFSPRKHEKNIFNNDNRIFQIA